MSIPSSSEDVDTTARSEPSFSIVSVIARSSLDTEPWWARAITGAAWPAVSTDFISCAGGRRVAGLNASGSCSFAHSSLSWLVNRSAVRREFTNTMVERCSITCWYTACSMCGQIELVAPGGGGDDSSSSDSASSKMASPMVEASSGTGRSDMSSTGTRTSKCQRFSAGGLMMVVLGPRTLATASIGRTVAESPMRWKSPASRRSRSSDSARCTPRFVPASAWISSTMTVSTVFRMPAALEVSMR